jgi:hypothetical protein
MLRSVIMGHLGSVQVSWTVYGRRKWMPGAWGWEYEHSRHE